jgi:hypothetical protein
MKHNTWQKNTSPEFRTPTWVRTDWLRGGTVERHEGTFWEKEYVKRDCFGNVTARKKTSW